MVILGSLHLPCISRQVCQSVLATLHRKYLEDERGCPAGNAFAETFLPLIFIDFLFCPVSRCYNGFFVCPPGLTGSFGKGSEIHVFDQESIGALYEPAAQDAVGLADIGSLFPVQDTDALHDTFICRT